MKKQFFVVVMLFACVLIFADDSGWAFFSELQSNYFSATNVPLEMRYIPIHPSDTYVSQSHEGPIERDSYKTKLFVLLGCEYSIENSSNTITRFKLMIPVYPEDDMQERNYTNNVGSEDRGYGAALTYCKLSKGGIFTATGFDGLTPALDLMPEISIEKLYGDNISFETSVGYFAVSFINGWDRWDAYTSDKSYLLANCIPISTDLKISFHNWKFSGGPVLVNAIKTTNGKSILKNDSFGWNFKVQYGF